MSPRVASIVLAAGGSRRMGRPKMLLPVGQGTLLRTAVMPHLESGLEPVVVVLGDRADEVWRGAGLGDDPRLVVVVNALWEQGLSSSLRRGLEACAATDAQAVLVALGDQPGMTVERLRAVREAWRPPVPLVVPVREGQPGHPVLFARSLWPELMAVSGDVGGRDVVRRHWADAVQVPAPVLPDLDTPEDYSTFLRGLPPKA